MPCYIVYEFCEETQYRTDFHFGWAGSETGSGKFGQRVGRGVLTGRHGQWCVLRVVNDNDFGLQIPFSTRNCRKNWNFGTECRKCGKVELGETSLTCVRVCVRACVCACAH